MLTIEFEAVYPVKKKRVCLSDLSAGGYQITIDNRYLGTFHPNTNWILRLQNPEENIDTLTSDELTIWSDLIACSISFDAHFGEKLVEVHLSSIVRLQYYRLTVGYSIWGFIDKRPDGWVFQFSPGHELTSDDVEMLTDFLQDKEKEEAFRIETLLAKEKAHREQSRG